MTRTKARTHILLILLLFSLLLSTTQPATAEETEWEDPQNYTITTLNPTITEGSYTIEALDFDWYGSVILKITHKNAEEEGILYRGESLTFFNEGIRIKAEDVSDINKIRDEKNATIGKYPCCPEAKIGIELAKTETTTPRIEVEMNNSWTGRLGGPIKTSIIVNNTGNIDLKNITLTIQLDKELIPLQKDNIRQNLLHYNKTAKTLTRKWTNLYSNNSVETKFQLTVLIPPNKSNYILTAEATGTTKNGSLHYGYASKILTLKPAISIKKTATKDTILGDYIYQGARDTFTSQRNTTYIQLIVKNQQSYNVTNIKIKDHLPPEFTTTEPLQWTLDLKPGEQTEIKYTTTATRPNLYVSLQQATAEWTEWNRQKTATSNTPTTAIHGPYIIIIKKQTQNKENNTTNIILEIENIGDIPARIKLEDPIADNTTLTKGNNTFEGIINPIKKHKITYTLTAHKSEINQTTPLITFRNKAYQGLYETIIIKDTLSPTKDTPAKITKTTITRIEKPENQTTTPTTQPKGLIEIINTKYPWIEGTLPILLLILSIIILWTIQSKKEQE